MSPLAYQVSSGAVSPSLGGEISILSMKEQDDGIPETSRTESRLIA
jgi:hypothetical protein